MTLQQENAQLRALAESYERIARQALDLAEHHRRQARLRGALCAELIRLLRAQRPHPAEQPQSEPPLRLGGVQTRSNGIDAGVSA